MAVTHVPALRNDFANLKSGQATTYAAGTLTKLLIYSGTVPTNAGTALSGNVVLSTQTALVYAAPSAGVMTSTTTADSSAVGGVGTFYRITKSDGVTAIEQGTFTATGSGGDLQATSTTIAAGANVSTSSMTYTSAP